jgi:site-specific DNA recombinase
MTDTRVIRTILYLRISDLRETDLVDTRDRSEWENAIAVFFAEREAQLREFAERLSVNGDRWEIVKVIRENDVIRRESRSGKVTAASAFRKRWVTLPDGARVKRVWRPGFQDMLRLLRDGFADGFLTENLNRVLRDPRDGVDLREVAQERGINARSMSGTLTLTDGGTRGERTMLGMMCEIAADFSENLSWSVAAGRERKSNRREYGGGKRPFGFEDDGLTKIPAECAVIKEMSERVIIDAKLRRSSQSTGPGKSPHSLAQMARELNERGVATVTGARWTPETVRDILLRPRNASIWVFRGKEDGKAPWEPIIDEGTFRRVVQILTAEDRSTNKGGRSPKWLGSGVYLCGKCNDGTVMNVTHTKPRAYRRKDGSRTPIPADAPRLARYKCSKHEHLTRVMKAVDEVVTDWIVDRLSQPDVLTLFVASTPTAAIDAPKLQAERATLEANLRELAIERTKGQITKDEHMEARNYAVGRIAEIIRELENATSSDLPSPLATLAKSVDVRETWNRYPLATKQAIIRRLIKITILPSPAGKFDPNSVLIEPIDWNAATDQAA